jgi:hypothetical protein
MLNQAQATQIARNYLSTQQTPSRKKLALFEDRTMTTEFGWVFFYSTCEHVETGDFLKGIPGNAPFIVDKLDGSIHGTGTGQPLQEFLNAYASKHQQ